MKRTLLVCALSILLIIPASIGVYAFAFLNEHEADEYAAAPVTQVVSNVVDPNAQPGPARPDTVYLAREAKSNLSETLYENASAIATRTGRSTLDVSAAVDGMEIETWGFASLPNSATISKSFEMNLGGEQSLVTTYNYPDQEYVTISNASGTVTLQGYENAGENLEDLAA